MTRRLRPEERETPVMDQVRLALGNRPDVRIWRNNRGKARRRLRDGSLSRPIEFGLAPGAADLIGLIAGGRFLAVEVKSATGELSGDQELWGALVRRFGGIYLVVVSAEDAVRQLEDALCRFPEARD